MQLFIICFAALFAVSYHWSEPQFSYPDTIPVLTSKDTIFLEVEEYPLKVYRHKVRPGQTLFSISRYFGLKVKELMYFNPQIESYELSLDTEIHIPIPSRVIRRYRSNKFDDSTFIPIYYKVQKGDNLFRIAMKYFKMPIDTIQKRNNIEGFTLSPGQNIHIGWMDSHGIPDTLQYSSGLMLNNFKLRREFYIANDTLVFNEQGPALWQRNGILNDEFLALHPTAKINSTLGIHNPLTRRTAYAKVIGRIPAQHSDVNIILSAAAAKYLGARDHRFFVKISYGNP